jgi:hypothetical protein
VNQKDLIEILDPITTEIVALEKRIDKMATTPDCAAAELRILARANLPTVTTVIHPGIGEAFGGDQS